VKSLKGQVTERNDSLQEDNNGQNHYGRLANYKIQKTKKRKTKNNTISKELYNDKEDKEYRFDEINYKLEHTFRVCFININGIPKSANHPKKKKKYIMQ
jgi:hypothetical protein